MKINRLFAIAFVLVFALSVISAVQPFGGDITEIKSERAVADNPTSDEAYAGNLTQLNVKGFSPTQTWQGYFGNVSGTIQLADASDNVMYNWTLAEPQGEIYASRLNNVDWSRIQCFNFTADSTLASADEVAGATSVHGKNLADYETEFGIRSDDVDGIDETFTRAGTHEQGNGFSHSLFYANNLEFAAGECPSTSLFGANGDVNDANFEEVLLYDQANHDLIFASILDEEATNGFDGNDYDFQMLVLENGHGTDTDTTVYHFYVELE